VPADDELVREITDGNPQAMEQLVQKHYKQIFAYVYRTVGDYHLAYDLTQEVFIKMMQSIERYKGKGKFSHWLMTIAVNHCRDFFRSKYFRQKKQEQELLQYIADPTETVWDKVSTEWKSDRIKKAIEELPLFQKEPIILRFYHDYKMKEIAKITKSNESTVKSRIRQGTTKLKRILEKRGVEDDFKEKRSNHPS